MSILKTGKIGCGHCGQSFDATICHSLNTRNPQLVETFLSGNMNVFTCPSCSKSFFIPFPVLYNDLRRCLMVKIDVMSYDGRPVPPKFECGIPGVRYRRRLDRDTQMIVVDDFAFAREAIRNLEDQSVLELIRDAHAEWPKSVVYAEAFIIHYKQAAGLVS